MTITLSQVKALEKSAAEYVKNGTPEFAKSITDSIIKAHAQGNIETDAWKYFKSKAFDDYGTASFI